MDVDGHGAVTLETGRKPEGGSAVNPEWAGADRRTYICVHGKPLPGGGWEAFEMSFTPAADGMVTIRLMGMCYREKGAEANTPVWILWDDVKVWGAELLNGEFDLFDHDGSLLGWTVGNAENIVVFQGNKCVKAAHDYPVFQQIRVVRDREVIVRAKVGRLE